MRMRPLLILFLSVLAVSPAMAKVLAEGKPKNGFYWQKVQNNSGKVSHLCRSTSDAKFQKGSKCEAAGAQQPK